MVRYPSWGKQTGGVTKTVPQKDPKTSAAPHLPTEKYTPY